MYGDIKLGSLTQEEIDKFLELIKQYCKNDDQIFLKKVNDVNEYYLCIPITVGAMIDPADQNIYTIFCNCYFMDLYCPEFSFITYSDKQDSFVSLKDTEGCILFNNDMNDIVNGIRQNTEDISDIFQVIYEILPIDNYDLDELQQIDIAKQLIMNNLSSG